MPEARTPRTPLRELADVTYGNNGHRRPTRVRGHLKVGKGDFAQACKDLLASHRDELQLGEDAETLQVVHQADTPMGKVVRYRQMRNGIPVHHSEVLVAADTSGEVTQIDLSHHAHAQVAPTDQEPMAAKEAVKAALDALGSPKTRQKPGTPEQVYVARGDELALAYRVLVAAAAPLHDWEVLVDAHTGAVLEQHDLIAHVDGSGLVFDPNPVVSAGTNSLRDPSATPTSCGFAGTPQATVDAQRVTRPLRDLTVTNGTYTLDGPWCRIHDFGSPATAIPSESNPNGFTYPSNDDRFDAVNLYYHVDSFQRYLQSLGITNANARKTDCDPHDNGSGGGAFYSPLDKGLHLGDSGPCQPDRAEDGDCPVHEYGHAIQDNMVPGWGVTNPGTGRAETRAVGEGYGDVLACLYFSEAHGGFQREVFEDWAFVPGGLRRVDGTKTYPTDWASDEHANGEIWSAALWNAYRALGGDSGDPGTRTAARDAVVKTLTLSNSLVATNATMPDAAEAVLRTEAALPERLGRGCMAYLDSFHARGILRCEAGVDLFLRDAAGDPGVDAFVGPTFWNSPDLWVRHADDGGTAHQDPEYGQDNWFYARVTNRGSVPARAFVVTFNVKTFAGTQFTYPGDFLPPISAAVGFDLAPGASTVVKAKWPRAAVPAPGTHACWLAQVYVPTDQTPSGRHVWESNNLAQKNLAIVDLIPGDEQLIQLVIGNLQEVVQGLHRFEIRRPENAPELPVTIEHRDPKVIEELFSSVERAPAVTKAGPETTGPQLHFLDPGRIEVGSAGMPVRMLVGAGTKVEVGAPAAAGIAKLVTADARQAEVVGTGLKRSISLAPGRLSGLPVLLKPRSPLSVGVRVQAPKEAKPGDVFPVEVVQRDADGQVVGGVTIQVNVT